PVANYDWLPMVKKLRGKPAAILKTDNYPLLVTFTDINDPASVKRVDPYDLEKHFGTGVKLKAVTLEITGEPVTKGEVEKVLGWFYEVNRMVPREKIKEYKIGEPIPGLNDFIDWKTQRIVRKKRNKK
ncbi:MAG: hypothetical protein GY742_09120, partial [Hyphomicrobiales bacterium]|nr:hypothetical protein [Hyphomicrobiales bacterium]